MDRQRDTQRDRQLIRGVLGFRSNQGSCTEFVYYGQLANKGRHTPDRRTSDRRRATTDIPSREGHQLPAMADASKEPMR